MCRRIRLSTVHGRDLSDAKAAGAHVCAGGSCLTSYGVRRVERGSAPPCVPLPSVLSVLSYGRLCALTPCAAPTFGSARQPARGAPMLVATPRCVPPGAVAAAMLVTEHATDASSCASRQPCSRCALPSSCASKRSRASASAFSRRPVAPSRVRSRWLASSTLRRASPRGCDEFLRE